MSTVPSELPEIGSTAQRLRQNPRFDPVAAGMGPEEYFVWARFDGATTLKDLILMTGFDTPKALDVVRRLRAMGAILLPAERPEQVTITAAAAKAPRPAAPPRPAEAEEDRPTTRVRASELLSATPAERAALAEQVELSAEERGRILEMHRRIGEGDRILGVADLADAKALKRAYFTLSKEFHPDRFYNRKTGSFAKRLEDIFEAVNRAYESLTEARVRRETKAPTLERPARGTPDRATPGTPVDYAAELFDRACQAEVSGDHVGALRLFDAALRVDAPARYLRRAARCAVNAGELVVAQEYANKAANLEPNDVSTARVLAHVLKVAGKLEAAEEVLVLAMMIKTENDQLAGELRHDLAEVRRLAAR